MFLLAEREPMELLVRPSSSADRRLLEDEAFAFDRCVSRLLEMQAADYCRAARQQGALDGAGQVILRQILEQEGPSSLNQEHCT